MTSKELRKKFLKYFANKDHQIISSASLIPENDSTVLFTTAGMQPLIPYLKGTPHPQGKRLVNVQKCWRTNDIEEVGDKTHHTFFEMLGNWSLGDYWKKEAIEYSWEFLIDILKLDKEKIAISIFGGNNNIKEADKESEQHWLALGIKKERIVKLANNWWGPTGEKGPCGPDTEIFYWVGKNKAPQSFNPKDNNWVEIWNNVFMEYNKTKDNKYTELKQKNIDTGLGLERTLAVLNNLDDNYLTDLFLPIIEELEKVSNLKYADKQKEFRIIIDHIRAATFLLADQRKILPSNREGGYVLRRIIRRAIRFIKKLNMPESLLIKLTNIVIEKYQEAYPELKKKKDYILQELKKESQQFKKTLDKGLKEFNKLVAKNSLNGQKAFYLFATYGFPLEMTLELAQEKGVQLSVEEYRKEFKKHQELSRTASAGMFKGGLADHSEMSKKYHTTTHLLHQALRTILGNHVQQKGSNINEKRLRFDFSHPNKMTGEEIKKVEKLINDEIKKELTVSWQEMTIKEAQESGAIGLFDNKYSEKIKVYSVGNFSKEICGGPHVKNTKELGIFKIKKENSSSSGIRRIKAILE